jgi:hypothetical protein
MKSIILLFFLIMVGSSAKAYDNLDWDCKISNIQGNWPHPHYKKINKVTLNQAKCYINFWSSVSNHYWTLENKVLENLKMNDQAICETTSDNKFLISSIRMFTPNIVVADLDKKTISWITVDNSQGKSNLINFSCE